MRMTFNGTELAAMAVLGAAGFAVSYIALQRRLQRALAAQQQATERQLSALAKTLRDLEHKLAELNQISDLQASAASEFEMESAAEVAEAAAPVAEEQEEELEEELEEEEVPAEMMPVLAAAAAELLGKKVRILSARKLEAPRQGLSPWSQQGRVFVQASHNLRARS
jgi:TolA-binding protein